jgi:hypothetical protein
MENALTILNEAEKIATLTKTAQTELSEQVALQIIEQPAQGYIKAKQMIETLEQAIKNPLVVKAVRDEAELYAKEGGLRLYGHKIEPIEAGTKYNYSECNDPIYKRLLEKKAIIEAEVKSREKFLQAVPYKGMSINDEETGEADITIYPPVKTSTSTVKVTFAK